MNSISRFLPEDILLKYIFVKIILLIEFILLKLTAKSL